MKSTKNKTLVLAAVIASTLLSMTAQAQEATAPPAQALDWMLGEWQGDGWAFTRNGTRNEFTVRETITSASLGHALLVHGVGASEGRVVHDAAGLISRGPDGYVMRAVNMYGQSQDVLMDVWDHGFTWELVMGPAGHVRFEAVYDGETWTETGAWCPAGGECIQNFRMQLSRVEAD